MAATAGECVGGAGVSGVRAILSREQGVSNDAIRAFAFSHARSLLLHGACLQPLSCWWQCASVHLLGGWGWRRQRENASAGLEFQE
jgi:hypothetical protein